MDWGAVEAIAEVIGLVLVVASLLFVGFQIRQNTQQLRQDNLLKTIRGTLDSNWHYHRDPRVFDIVRRGCADFDGLPAADQAHFHSIVVDLSFYLELVMRMNRAGLIDDDAPEVNMRFFLSILDSPGGRQWWEVARRTKPMPEEAIEAIQAMLDRPGRERVPITELQPWLALDTETRSGS